MHPCDSESLGSVPGGTEHRAGMQVHHKAHINTLIMVILETPIRYSGRIPARRNMQTAVTQKK